MQKFIIVRYNLDIFHMLLISSEVEDQEIIGKLKNHFFQDGFLSSAPYFISFPLSLLVAWIADYIINNQILSRTVTRKMFTSIGT